MERLFQFIAAVLIGAAAYFFWVGNNDWFFVSVVASCVFVFLGFRVSIRASLDEIDAERAAEMEKRSPESEADRPDGYGELAESREQIENASVSDERVPDER